MATSSPGSPWGPRAPVCLARCLPGILSGLDSFRHRPRLRLQLVRLMAPEGLPGWTFVGGSIRDTEERGLYVWDPWPWPPQGSGSFLLSCQR